MVREPIKKSIKLLLILIKSPFEYNNTQLAEKTGISRTDIPTYINQISEAGLILNKKNQKWGILPEKSHPELQRLLALNDSDMNKIKRALDHLGSNTEKLYLVKKLERLLNFQKLGLRALRNPLLDKMDMLEESKVKKTQVKLVGYRSNSNEIRDRLIECIKLEPEIGTVQAFDVESKKVRHFKLDRFDKVETFKNKKWSFEQYHHTKDTDVFRIADNNQSFIHLHLDVKARNLLIDSFPKADAYILTSQNGGYDFEAKVNHKFLGLLPFIMANYDHITIIEPPQLKSAVADVARKIYLSESSTHN